MSAIWSSVPAPHFARHHRRPDRLLATPVCCLQTGTLQISEQIGKFVAEMFGQFAVGIVAIVAIDQTNQLGFKFAGERCQTMLT